MRRVADFGDREFRQFSELVYQQFGIHLTPAKQAMLQAKLGQLLRRHGLSDYQELYRLLTGVEQQRYLVDLADVITTNKTEFFREVGHFDFIRQRMQFILQQNPRISRSQEIRAWSAGCSTGEEPYTLGMVLLESLPSEIRIRILATDINHRVLSRAQRGLYPAELEQSVGSHYLHKYFHQVDDGYQVNDVLRRVTTFRSFNLVNPLPLRDTVDIIFCRNVMIYFDQRMQEALLKRFHDALTPGGLLFIGHSESLSNRKHAFRYVQPTIYQRPR